MIDCSLHTVRNLAHVTQEILMKKTPTPPASLTTPASRSKLDWRITVETRQIDFMDADAVMVAGSTSDCSAISPLPANPRKRGSRTSI